MSSIFVYVHKSTNNFVFVNKKDNICLLELFKKIEESSRIRMPKEHNMAKQVKIKDIAEKAGVSRGTVDRILHNRGNVSDSSRRAVERVLAETGYRFNIHTSAVSLKKGFKLIISTPEAVAGEYWDVVGKGIEHALEEYFDITIDCEYVFYNQFDIYSCRNAFDSIVGKKPDAVIIGATFVSETKILCDILDREKIPYAFIDSVIEGTHPVATYSSNQNACGRMIGRLLDLFAPADAELAIFSSRRIGNERANNSMRRMAGLKEYFRDTDKGRIIKESKISVLDPEESKKDIIEFIGKNPKVKGIAVLNSRGYIVADALAGISGNDISIVSFDLTVNNSRCIRNGSIAAVICQRPEMQGFYAVKAIISALLYNPAEKNIRHFMPVDIVIRENLDDYGEIFAE